MWCHHKITLLFPVPSIAVFIVMVLKSKSTSVGDLRRKLKFTSAQRACSSASWSQQDVWEREKERDCLILYWIQFYLWLWMHTNLCSPGKEATIIFTVLSYQCQDYHNHENTTKWSTDRYRGWTVGKLALHSGVFVHLFICWQATPWFMSLTNRQEWHIDCGA